MLENGVSDDFDSTVIANLQAAGKCYPYQIKGETLRLCLSDTSRQLLALIETNDDGGLALFLQRIPLYQQANVRLQLSPGAECLANTVEFNYDHPQLGMMPFIISQRTLNDDGEYQQSGLLQRLPLLNNGKDLSAILVRLTACYVNTKLDDLDDTIHRGLADMAQFFNAQRGYLFDYEFAMGFCCNTYEWCEEGVSSHIDELQDVPLSMVEELMIVQHKQGLPFEIACLDDYPEGEFKNLLQDQGIKSLVALPMFVEDKLVGFIGFDSVYYQYTCSESDYSLLGLFVEVIVNIRNRASKEIDTHAQQRRLLDKSNELAEQTAMLSSLLENIPDYVYAKDVQGKYLLVNPPACRLFGLSSEQIIGKDDYELFDAAMAANMQADDLLLLAQGGHQKNEMNMSHADGRELQVEMYKSPFFNPQGELLGVLGIAHNVTEFKATAKAFKDANATLSMSLYLAHSAVWSIDCTNRTDSIRLSPELLDLLGKPSSVNGQTLSLDEWGGNIIATDPVAGVHAADDFRAWLLSPKQGLFQAAWQYTRENDGKVIWVESVANAQFNKSGVLIKVIGLCQDITERKQAELALQSNEERIRLLLDATHEGIYGIDLSGSIIFSNVAMEKLLGYSRDELIGKKAHDLFHSDFAPCPLCEGLLQGEQCLIDNEELRHKDGGTIHVAFSANPLLRHGKLIGSVASFTDITQRVEAERQLIIAKDVAEDASRAKSDFLANMSHEIRTPMNAIIGMSYLALQTDLDRKQHNYINKVHQSAESLLGIINDILDFSKIEAGKLDLEVVDFDLDNVFSQLADVVGIRAEQKNLALLFDIPPSLPRLLQGDPLRLGQVLLNLVGNAVKFTEQGKVTVRVHTIQEHDGAVSLRFEVEDTGIGLSREQQSHLFSAFTQADSSTTRQYGGTGLGLAISKRFCELMGGEIGLDSQEGQGSTFWFTIQLKLQNKQSSVDGRSRLSNISDLVLVEANHFVAEHQKQLFHHFGVHVHHVTELQQALPYLQQHKVDLLLIASRCLPEADIENPLQPHYPLPPIILTLPQGDDGSGLNVEALYQLPSAQLHRPLIVKNLLQTIKQVQCGSSDNIVSSGFIAPASCKDSSLAGAHVLLVEDNLINQELALELLQREGLRVTTVVNGKEAVDMMSEKTFDGVLMDCQMPVMDGYTATKIIRSMPQGKSLPIIAMTANAMDGDRDKVLAVGMDDYISKPLNIDAMLSTISKWIKPKHNQAAALPTPFIDKSELSEAFPELAGVVVQEGLKNCLNDSVLYRKLLLKFAKQYQAASNEFHHACVSKDNTEAQRFAHTLKGLAASIGAHKLQQKSESLEHLCGTSAPVRELMLEFEAIQTDLDEVIRAILSAIDAHSGQRAVSEDELEHASLPILYKDLRQLLLDNDSDAIEIAEKLEALVGSVKQGQVKSLIESVLAYDFDLALDELDKLEQE